jgi:hypothetical protein
LEAAQAAVLEKESAAVAVAKDRQAAAIAATKDKEAAIASAMQKVRTDMFVNGQSRVVSAP